MQADTTTIHVHTFADKRTVSYAHFMWNVMLRLASRPDRLRLTIHGMSPKATEAAQQMCAADNVQCVLVQRPDWMTHDEPMAGSTGHGAAIEAALATVRDNDIHIIADADTVVVAKGWDAAIRQKIIGQRCGIVGTTYEPIGGFSSGNSTNQTYKDLPTVTWMALAPWHPWSTMQARPAKTETPYVTVETTGIYNLPVGHTLLRDVGWQIPMFIRDNGVTALSMKHLKHDNGAVVLNAMSPYHEEFHLDGAPFVVHQRGSLRHAYRADKLSVRFYEVVDAYLASEVNRPPRWR